MLQACSYLAFRLERVEATVIFNQLPGPRSIVYKAVTSAPCAMEDENLPPPFVPESPLLSPSPQAKATPTGRERHETHGIGLFLLPSSPYLALASLPRRWAQAIFESCEYYTGVLVCLLSFLGKDVTNDRRYADANHTAHGIE